MLLRCRLIRCCSSSRRVVVAVRMHVPIKSAVEQAAVKGMRAGARAVLKRSNELAPKDDEDLARNGRVRVDDLTVQVSYDSPYAVLQHERLDYEHAGGGQAKFLETAAREVSIEAAVAAEVRRALGG